MLLVEADSTRFASGVVREIDLPDSSPAIQLSVTTSAYVSGTCFRFQTHSTLGDSCSVGLNRPDGSLMKVSLFYDSDGFFAFCAKRNDEVSDERMSLVTQQVQVQLCRIIFIEVHDRTVDGRLVVVDPLVLLVQ